MMGFDRNKAFSDLTLLENFEETEKNPEIFKKTGFSFQGIGHFYYVREFTK